MPIDAIARVGTEQVDFQNTAVNIEDFLEIFLTQLNFQDPLEPVDNREFIAQLAQFSSLQIANETNDSTEGLLDVSSVAQTMSLLGRQVQAIGPDGATVVGSVSGIEFDAQGQPLLTLTTNGNQAIRGINPAQITVITGQQQLASNTNTNTTDDNN